MMYELFFPFILTRSKSASDNHNGSHGSTATKQSNEAEKERTQPSEITSEAITFMVFSSINGFGLPSIFTDPSLKGGPDAISTLLHLYQYLSHSAFGRVLQSESYSSSRSSSSGSSSMVHIVLPRGIRSIRLCQTNAHKACGRGREKEREDTL